MTEIDLYADENEPEVKLAFHVYKVEIPSARRSQYQGKYLPHVYVAVDDYNQISVETYSVWFGERVDKMPRSKWKELYEWLTEWELAEWRAIGPEDSELFATERLTGDERRTD